MVATQALSLNLERTIDNHAIRVASQTRLQTVLSRICQTIDANGNSDLAQQYGCVWVEEREQLVGRWSDRDAVRWCAAGRSITPETTVAQVMEPPGQPLSLARDWDAIALLLLFQQNRQGFPAITPDGRLIGIATLARLLEFLQPPNLLKLTHLSEITLPTAATVASATSIRNVARLLVERDLDSAIVATELPRIVSNYDIFLALARGWDLDATPVSTIARSVGHPLSPQDFLARAYRTMRDRHSRELLVADPETDRVTIATDLDLLRSLDPKQMYVSLQRSYGSVSQLKAKNQQLLQQRNAELERQVQRRTAELEATTALATRQAHRATLLNQIVRSLRSSLDLDRVLQTTVNCLHEALYVNRCLLFRPDPDCQMRSRHVSEATQGRDSVLGIPCDLYRQYHATLSQGDPLVISTKSSSLPPETIASLDNCNIRSVLVVPLICGNEFIGGISLHQCDAERHWTTDEISFVQQIADHCAIAIQQSQLYRQLRQSEANYRNLFDNAIEGIYQTTPDGRYLNVNPALAQMYGYDSPEALMAANLNIERDVYVEPQRRLEFTRRLETDGRVAAFESQVYRRDGSTFWIRENARAARKETGTILYFEGTVEDISDRKQAERELHLLQSITQAVSQALDFNAALEVALEQIGQATGWTYGEAWIPNHCHCCLEVAPGWWGDRDDTLLAFRQVTQSCKFAPASGLPGRVWASQQPEWIRDVSIESPSFFLRADLAAQSGLKAAFGVPILDNREVVAVLALFANESRRVDRATVQLITDLASQLGELMRRKQADAALRTSQQKLSLHVQQTPLAAIEWTTEFEVASWNPSAEAIFGYSAEEAIGKKGSELLVPAAVRDKIDGVWQELIRQRGGKRNINKNITKNRREIVCEWYNTPLIDANGRTIGVASLAQDITDRVEARMQLQQLNQQLETQVRDRTAELQQTIAALRDSEARYRLMAENSTDMIARHALDGTYLYVSPASHTLLGYEPEELEGRNAFDLFHPQDLGTLSECYERILAAPVSCTVSYRIRRQDGNYLWFETTTRAIRDADTDPPQEIVAVSRDISARKQAETELKYAKEQLEAMLDAIPGFVSWMDRDLRYLGVNRHLAAAFGRQPDEFVGRELGFIKANSEFAQFIADFFQDTSAIAANATIELPIGGQPRQYAIAVQKYNNGKKAVSVGIDVSDRMAAEAQIKQSLQEKEVLLKEIHHRVKNNLQIVSSLLKLQAGTINDPEVLKPFTDSYNRVRSMALIHEKLYQSDDLDRVRTVEYLRNLTANLFDSYTAATNQIQLDLQLDNIDLNIDTAIPCGLIITELLSNAIKYAFPDDRAGTIWVEFRDLGDRLRLSVCDNGVGLPDDFDLDESESLGLQLVTSLTEQLHGELDIQSEPRMCFAIEFKRPKSLD